jgi:peptidoglycan/xylan/chitin deacetylase (PgdA/CDA1 family)
MDWPRCFATTSWDNAALEGPQLVLVDRFSFIVSLVRRTAPTVVLTFDNLGEAAELERGAWPADRPVGQHPSVSKGLPRLLAELDGLGLRATFFVEAINCVLHPDAVRSIAEHGHEIGIHGWRHESWEGLAPEHERTILEHSRAAFDGIGVDARAFRPPGGAINAGTPTLLKENGCRWASPLGTRTHVDEDGFGWVPFEWGLVDAYFLMERFGSLRAHHGDPASPVPPAATAERLRAGLYDATGPRTLILHPFLLADDEWWIEARALLRALADLHQNGRLAITPGGELVDRLSCRP